ncbi:MAG: DEAD/DEAH box helicase [Gemmatimonadota bacterium]|nr:DEAD/DEAH box helicase [Gemmatimonadota bacterium]
MALSEPERLQLQQLRLLAWAEQQAAQRAARETSGEGQAASDSIELPQDWSLTSSLELHPWQTVAREAWFSRGLRGTIKVVTGAGKTVVALAIAERLQELDHELRVAIVVPTIVLMQQWHSTILNGSNLPSRAIGRLGGGHSDDFSGDRRVLIAVLASARKELPDIVRRAGAGEHLLLIVDESHRAGAPQMSEVLSTQRAYSLALSATPERSDDEGTTESDILADELGEVVFEMSFADAIDQEILPPFEIHHFGLPLSPGEANEYQALTRSLNEARRELRAMSPAARKAGGGEGLLAWARRVSSRPSGNVATLAAKYVNETTRRKQLLYRADSRTEATLLLVRRALASGEGARVILFHESIEEVVSLFEQMARTGIPAVMEHSGLSTELRESSLDLFRLGAAQVVVSARSLIEGFNVPEADLGIIVASSSSARQRIQSIGRVLRKYRDAEGEQKSSRVCVLYMRDTVDETIYEKEDWDKLIGLDRNRYFTWDPPVEPTEQAASPRAPVPREDDIDVEALKAGEVYPGRYDGAEFSADTMGNVADPDGRIALNPQGVPTLIAELVERPGRFKVTPKRNAILVRRPVDEEAWTTVFVGVLVEPFSFPVPGAQDESVDASSLSPGDAYPGPLEPATEFLFRQRGGGVVARRVRGGQEFGHGPEAEKVVEALQRVSLNGKPVSRFFVNELGDAFWREQGAARFIAHLDDRIEFPGGHP